MLYREIEKHAEEYKNVAYFCKFDRDSKSSGRETLFLSNGKPILAEDGVKEFFQRVESLSGEIPFFLSYDSVSEFYPVQGIKRSGWPMAAAFEPEKVLHSSYTRNPQESLRGRVSDDISRMWTPIPFSGTSWKGTGPFMYTITGLADSK